MVSEFERFRPNADASSRLVDAARGGRGSDGVQRMLERDAARQQGGAHPHPRPRLRDGVSVCLLRRLRIRRQGVRQSGSGGAPVEPTAPLCAVRRVLRDGHLLEHEGARVHQRGDGHRRTLLLPVGRGWDRLHRVREGSADDTLVVRLDAGRHRSRDVRVGGPRLPRPWAARLPVGGGLVDDHRLPADVRKVPGDAHWTAVLVDGGLLHQRVRHAARPRDCVLDRGGRDGVGGRVLVARGTGVAGRLLRGWDRHLMVWIPVPEADVGHLLHCARGGQQGGGGRRERAAAGRRGVPCRPVRLDGMPGRVLPVPTSAVAGSGGEGGAGGEGRTACGVLHVRGHPGLTVPLHTFLHVLC